MEAHPASPFTRSSMLEPKLVELKPLLLLVVEGASVAAAVAPVAAATPRVGPPQAVVGAGARAGFGAGIGAELGTGPSFRSGGARGGAGGAGAEAGARAASCGVWVPWVPGGALALALRPRPAFAFATFFEVSSTVVARTSAARWRLAVLSADSSRRTKRASTAVGSTEQNVPHVEPLT